MRWFRKLLLYLFSGLCVLPIFMVFIASLRGAGGAPAGSGYFVLLLGTPNFYRGFWLSLAYSVSIVVFSVAVSMTSAYGIVRCAFRGSRIVLWAYILLMLLPFQATLVPQYFALRWMGLNQSPAAVVLPGIFSTFGAVMIAQYMRGLDSRLFDAARLDGMNELQLFVRLALPLCRPIAVGLLFILFVGAWSMVEQPLVFLKDLRQMPLSVSIRMDKRVRGLAYAAGIVYSVLPLLLYRMAHREMSLGLRGFGSVVRHEEAAAMNGFSSRRGSRFGGRLLIGFLAAMLVLSVAAAKIHHLTMNVVEPIPLRGGEVLVDASDPHGGSHGFFPIVVPVGCIHRDQGEPVVYRVAENPLDRSELEVVELEVEVLVENQRVAAIRLPLLPGESIIRWSTRPPVPGEQVRLTGGGAKR